MIQLRAFATLWDLINYVFGTHFDSQPPNSFGFFVAAGFGVGLFVAIKELKRREALGIFTPTKTITIEGEAPKIMDYLGSAVVGGVFGLKIIGVLTEYSTYIQSPEAYLLSLKGSWLGAFLGAVIMGYWKYAELKKEQLPKPVQKETFIPVHERMGDILIRAVIGGVLGSKIFDMVESKDAIIDFFQNPISSLTSGLSIFGGLWLSALLIYLYAKKHNINIWSLLDSLAPAFFMAYAVGRLGCQTAGDGCWGIENTFPKPAFVPDFLWAQTYAHNVNHDGIPILNCTEKFCHVLPIPHFPTPLYETIIVSILFLIMWSIRKKITNNLGMMFGIFMVFNGVERFLIEFLRVTQKYDFLGFQFSQAQFISIAMVLAGSYLIWIKRSVKFSK